MNNGTQRKSNYCELFTRPYMDHVASTRLDANLRTAIDPEEGTWMEMYSRVCFAYPHRM